MSRSTSHVSGLHPAQETQKVTNKFNEPRVNTRNSITHPQSSRTSSSPKNSHIHRPHNKLPCCTGEKEVGKKTNSNNQSINLGISTRRHPSSAHFNKSITLPRSPRFSCPATLRKRQRNFRDSRAYKRINPIFPGGIRALGRALERERSPIASEPYTHPHSSG